MLDAPPRHERVYSVRELSHVLKVVLEETFPQVWVQGEISNFTRPQSGHCYFTLKDEEAQLKAVIWKTTANRVPFELHDGLSIICRGRLDLYPPRGAYQLIVDQLVPQGVGALELALRQLREKLTREGLFEQSRKRTLPRYPRRVAFVTSPTGAAVRDFLEVLRRRWRGVDVLIIPARVQGEGAARQIAQGIEIANRLRPAPDVLVVGRGGGSLEDLWAFNEEILVRAVAASKIVTVSAVGHEIDVTLCDLAADVRALTPSEAAERVVPSAEDLRNGLVSLHERMRSSLTQKMTSMQRELAFLARSAVLRRPYDRILLERQRLDEWTAKASRALWNRLQSARVQANTAAGRLDDLSPLKVLARGYSLCETMDGRLITRAGELKQGDRILNRFPHSYAVSLVESIDENASPFGPEALGPEALGPNE